MSIMMVTSLNSYVKTMQMAVKWQKKQEEGNYTPDNAESADKAESAKKTFQKQLDELRYPEYDRSAQMEYDIELKMTAGKKLSGEEMSYLKTHNRSVYQMAKKIEKDRSLYEKALESCASKEEVEQLKADYAATAVKRINAIRNDSSLSLEKKRELFRYEHFRAAALDDAMHTFTDSMDYSRLPDKIAPQTDEAENNEQENEPEFKLLDRESILSPESELEFLQENSVRQTDPDFLEELKARQTKISGKGVNEPLNIILQENKTEQTKTAEEAVHDAVEGKETDTEKNFSVLQESADDAAEEGSIMKAILDEEARWAKEEEENALASREADSSPADSSQTETMPETFKIKQAKAAYLAFQNDTIPAQSSRIDTRR